MMTPYCLLRRILPMFGGAWLAVLVSVTPLAASPGDEHWDVPFGWPGTTNTVYALAVNGDRVYAGGLYGTPAIVETNFVEVWDGTRWSYIAGLEDTLVLYDFAFLGGD